MKHIIIDTGRCNSKRFNYRSRRRSDKWPKDLATERMLPRRRYSSKQMTDRLGPLWRTLRSRVGDKWNNVYSDICKDTDNRNIRGYHLRNHIKDLVQTYTFYEDNEICVPYTEIINSDGDNKLYKFQPYDELLYVNPEGILCLREKTDTWDRKKEYPKRFLFKNNYNLAKGLNDIWYWVKYESISTPESKYRSWENYYDYLFQRKVSFNDLIRVYKKGQRCIEKKQLNKRDLRKYKLKNGSSN